MVGPCPYCLTTVQFSQLFSTEQMAFKGDAIIVLQCPKCRQVHAVFFRSNIGGPLVAGGATMDKTGQWPLEGVLPPHDAVPVPVAEDWTEAHKALGVGLWKAAVTMARRAVQGVCIDQGASGKKKLQEQIDDLGKTDNPLHPMLVTLAHKIRSFGNLGAHPGEDGLNDVDEDEARVVVAFLDQLLHYVYELADQISQLNPKPKPATP